MSLHLMTRTCVFLFNWNMCYYLTMFLHSVSCSLLEAYVRAWGPSILNTCVAVSSSPIRQVWRGMTSWYQSQVVHTAWLLTTSMVQLSGLTPSNPDLEDAFQLQVP